MYTMPKVSNSEPNTNTSAAAYAAADVFVLGSLFETFGIVYIEAMAMGLPVVCTDHPNQRSIVREGIFVDMGIEGALHRALMETPRHDLVALGNRGIEIATQNYDWVKLKGLYLSNYKRMADAPAVLPKYSARHKVAANLRNAWARLAREFPR